MRATVTQRMKSVFARKLATEAQGECDDLCLGDLIETVSTVIVRQEEGKKSDVLEEVNAGIAFQVVQMGAYDIWRCQVRNYAGQVGWISMRVKTGEWLVQKSKVATISPEGLMAFVAGTQVETLLPRELSTKEELSSPMSLAIPVGVRCTIVANSKTDATRVQVSCNGNVGWMSLVSQRGELLVARIGSCPSSAKSTGSRSPAASSSPSTKSHSIVKSLLDAAKAGDVKGLQAIMETPVVFAGVSRKGPNPNSTSAALDGKTALMLAAANGHKATVKILLCHPDIKVNLVDDRGRSALHETALLEGDLPVEVSVRKSLAEMLLAAGADPYREDNYGRRPADYAWEFGYKELASLLRQAAGEEEPAPPEVPAPAAEPVPNDLAAVAEPAEVEAVQEAVEQVEGSHDTNGEDINGGSHDTNGEYINGGSHDTNGEGIKGGYNADPGGDVKELPKPKAKRKGSVKKKVAKKSTAAPAED